MENIHFYQHFILPFKTMIDIKLLNVKMKWENGGSRQLNLLSTVMIEVKSTLVGGALVRFE